MSPNPDSFLEHLKVHGYHPRSNKHSNALGEAIVVDLLESCPILKSRAASGEIVYDLNFTLRAGHSDWNVDLVIGTPARPVPPTGGAIISAEKPVFVQIAAEFKAVMTEHRKAVKNRKRDLEAHHEHVRNYDLSTISAGVLIINGSSNFRSPLRVKDTVHKNPDKVIEHCLNELRSVARRSDPRGVGLDACCAIVVDITNLDAVTTCYSDSKLAPKTGDPLHYDSFIQTMCRAYQARFSSNQGR